MKRASGEDKIHQAYPFISFSLARCDGETLVRSVVIWDDFGHERGVLHQQEDLSIALDRERPVFRLGTYEELGFLQRYRVDAGVKNVQVSWVQGRWECRGASKWILDEHKGDRWPGDISELRFNEDRIREQSCGTCGAKAWSTGLEYLHGNRDVYPFLAEGAPAGLLEAIKVQPLLVPWHSWAVHCAECGEHTHIPDSQPGSDPRFENYVVVPPPLSRRVVAYAHWLLGLLSVMIAVGTGSLFGRLGQAVGGMCGFAIAMILHAKSQSFLKGTIRPRKDVERAI